MSAAALKARLRADLKTAMQARAADEVRVLRVLIAALDNAEAVPSDEKPHTPRAFGDPSGEVARLDLDDEAVDRLLTSEIETRLAAGAEYELHGRREEAQRLRDEARLIARYEAS